MKELMLEKNNDFTIVHLSGRLDITISEEIEKILVQTIEEGSIKLIIDLGNVEYFSSSAMRVLIAIKRLIHEKKGVLRLCRISNMVNKIMSALELIKVFEIYDSIEEAIKMG